MDRVFKTFPVLLFTLVSVSRVYCYERQDDGVPFNPCIVTLCIENTTCIAIPDPQNCQTIDYTTTCALRARCIPNGAQIGNYGGTIENYCGADGRSCDPGFKCGLVYPFCPVGVKPCLPMLGCVPIPNYIPPSASQGLCKGVICKPGQHCEEVTINCITTPCPPSRGECVDDKPEESRITCANVRCPKKCEMQTQCDGYDCKEVPVCVDSTSN